MSRPTHDPLTDQRVRALQPRTTPIDVRDGELRGLILTVLPSGRKQFAVRYRRDGKQKRHVLGDYPAVSLAVARRRARKAQAAIDDGRDLVAERQAQKAARTDTVATLATEYLEKHARKFKRSAAEDERILKVEILPRWKDRSVHEITRRDVRSLVEHVATRAPIMGNRVLALVRRMLNFAIDHDWIEANPAARVRKPSPETSRDRVLSPDEIRRLWRILSRFPATAEKPAPGRQRASGDENDPLCPISPALATVLKVRLLTAQRGGEVARMRWADLELSEGWWTIPGQHTKNGQPHRVPLTRDVVQLIQGQEPKGRDRGELVFVGRRSATVLDRAKKAPAEIARALRFEFRGHDLRRTAATNMAAAGVPRNHISHVLNHVEDGPRATKIYDRYAYDSEKRIALDAWARRLASIVNEKAETNVVAFAAAK